MSHLIVWLVPTSITQVAENGNTMPRSWSRSPGRPAEPIDAALRDDVR